MPALVSGAVGASGGGDAAKTLGPVEPALDWSETGAPVSRDTGDIFFNPADGLGESRLVFLAGCDLPAVWVGRSMFTVGELGFGSGLNVLALLDLWRRTRPSPVARLHIVSIEAAPFHLADAERAHGAFPELAEVAAALRAVWPERIAGVIRRELPALGVTLTLAHLPVIEALDALAFQADAWFLDGFAPSLNADMWSAEVFARIASKSAPGARLGTFTVAGAVRRGLAAAGFRLERRPGFGHKRECLAGVYDGPAPARTTADLLAPRGAALGSGGRLVVVGGGIGGAAAAFAAARALGPGRVTLLTGPQGLGDGASGNPRALLMPRLDLDDRPPARFHRAAYLHALNLYREIAPGAVETLGVIECSRSPEAAKRARALLASGALPPEHLGPTGAGDLLHREAGVVEPRPLLEALTAGLDVRAASPLAGLDRIGDHWRLTASDGAVLAEAEAVILALGPDLARLPGFAWMGLVPRRGQITLAPWRGVAPFGPALTYGGYAAPAGLGAVILGATYGPDDGPPPDAAARALRDQAHLADLAAIDPARAAAIDLAEATSRVSVRATTPDRLPLAGPAPDVEAARARFAPLGAGQRFDPAAGPAPIRPGLFLLAGLGSRGFAWAPLLGETLAADLAGAPRPIETGAALALSPMRVIARRVKRGG